MGDPDLQQTARIRAETDNNATGEFGKDGRERQ